MKINADRLAADVMTVGACACWATLMGGAIAGIRTALAGSLAGIVIGLILVRQGHRRRARTLRGYTEAEWREMIAKDEARLKTLGPRA